MSSRILVVDDDVALAEMIGIVLQNEGFRVVFVPTDHKRWLTFRNIILTLFSWTSCCPGWMVSTCVGRSVESPTLRS